MTVDSVNLSEENKTNLPLFLKLFTIESGLLNAAK